MQKKGRLGQPSRLRVLLLFLEGLAPRPKGLERITARLTVHEDVDRLLGPRPCAGSENEAIQQVERGRGPADRRVETAAGGGIVVPEPGSAAAVPGGAGANGQRDAQSVAGANRVRPRREKCQAD